MDEAEIRRRHAQTGAAWNEAAAQYEREFQTSVAFLRAGGTNFCQPEFERLTPLARRCTHAVHLQCAAGHDTLSLWNLGAPRVTGVDISERMLALAQRKSDALGAPAQWVHSDVLELPESLRESADLVYTGRGALCWNLDIGAWARSAASVLSVGGTLFVYDGHPLDWVWRTDVPNYELDPQYGDYFDSTVFTDAGWPECYIPEGNKPTGGWSPKHERQWTLGAIVTAVADAGLVVTALEEHPDDFWEGWHAMTPENRRRLPHTFLLTARKPASE
jgi:SAM-dependent methyltransferase